MRNRKLLTILLGLLIAVPAFSQDVVEVKRVETDSLITVLRNEFGQKIYYLHNEKDQNTYTLSASRSKFVDAALGQLREKGYTVSQYDGAWYVATGLAINSKLPVGYFSEKSSEVEVEYADYLKDDVETATFANRVYEIGDRKEGRTGKARVSGYINDSSTGEPIIGVSVVDDKTGVYTVTDSYGFYNISMPIGDGSLSFNGYSLEPLNLKVIVYDDGSLNVAMHEKVNALKEAVISAESNTAHRDPAMGVERMRVNVITKVPVAFGEGDVLKVVTTLPGVKSVGEASSGFNVRGGSVDQNLILFNDGTVFNPSHMFGIFSAFNTEVINDVQLYKSSIPAEFGGRISSVLDIKSREGNANKVEGSLGIGLLTSKFHLEGPLKKGKTTFLIGGRTTYSNWIMKLLPANSGYNGGKSQFYDANASISHKFNDHNSLHVYGYYSRDKFQFSGDTTFRYSNINASIKWRNNFSQNHGYVLVAGYDQYGNTLDNYIDAWEAYRYQTYVRQAYTKLNFKSVVGDNHTLKYGFQTIAYIMDPGIKTPLGEESAIVPWKLNLETAIEPSVYISDTWAMGDKFSLDYGVRVSGFTQFKDKAKFYAMPEGRVSMKYSFLPNLSLKAGVNSMRQYIHLVTNSASISPMDSWKLSDDKIKPQDGWQGAGGLYWTVGESQIDISLEAYFKQMWNYLDYKSGATLVMNPDIAEALVPTKGKAYGAELMIKKPNGKLNGWISYTYSRTLLKEMQDRGMQTINGGAWYPAAHDKPHDLKVVANYKFTHRYSVSANLDYSTGRPVTIPVGKYYYGGGIRLSYSERNGYRIPDYFRLDLAFNIDPGHYLKDFVHSVITVGVYNVTGRKNAYSVYYTAHGGSQVSGYMLSVFAVPVPYINLNFKF